MMSDEQRDALREQGLTYVSTTMGNTAHDFVLVARRPAPRVGELGELVLIDVDGTVHPYVDGRAQTIRVPASSLPTTPITDDL